MQTPVVPDTSSPEQSRDQAITLTAPEVFTGTEWLADPLVVVRSGMIRELIPAHRAAAFREQNPGVAVRSFPKSRLVPAFIDLQLYGASGRLFSAYPDPESLRALAAHGRAGGTVWSVPTVATNSPEVMHACIDAVRAYQEQGGTGIHGLHLEGPWINPVRRGAHVEAFIHPPTMQEVRNLLDRGEGVIKVITLAPEVCAPEIIRHIASRGILVSAGHSDASYQQATDAFNAGISTVTHLFNAMSPLHHRAPGLVGAVLDHPTVMASIIPDGHHVDFAAVRLAKKVMGERLFTITDAVTETTTGPYPHQRAGEKYESEGILSGSALSMNQAVANLVENGRVPPAEALRMCSLYPAQLLGLRQHGRIEAGYRAELLVLDRAFAVRQLLG